MSNFTDVLLLNALGYVLVCQPRPVPAAILHDGTEYATVKYENENGEKFHIGVPEGYTPDDFDTDTIIFATNLQPAWDLR